MQKLRGAFFVGAFLQWCVLATCPSHLLPKTEVPVFPLECFEEFESVCLCQLSEEVLHGLGASLGDGIVEQEVGGDDVSTAGFELKRNNSYPSSVQLKRRTVSPRFPPF